MLLTTEQVTSFRKLNRLLRRLKIIGSLEFDVKSKSITEFNKPVRYVINITGYLPGKYYTREDEIEEFESKLLNLMIRQSD